MVRMLGHTPVVAWSAASALSLWKETEHAFDLAVVDYVLNDGSGLALAEELRREKPTMPIFIATGMDKEDVEMPPGIGFLGKPFSIDELRGAIDGSFRKGFSR